MIILCLLVLGALLPKVQADDWIQTTQSDFETGSGVNIDTISQPGNVTLAQHWQKYPTVPVVDLGPPGSWDDYGISYPMVIKDGATYKMWYTGSDGSAIPPYRIGYATSSDGITWTKDPSNPIFGLGTSPAWDDTKVYMASVIFDGVTYKLWYTGNNGPNDRIGYATSPDGISWTRYAGNSCSGTSGPGCVLDKGTAGSWDDVAVRKPTVVYDGALYHMWFSGLDGANWRIGYATSSDGIAWAKYAGNSCLGTSGNGCVLDIGPSGSWEDVGVVEAGAYYDGSMFHIWYSGTDGSVGRTGYATSQDGINWTRCPANPVIHEESPGFWDGLHAYTPMVIHDSGLYHMWYSGRDATNYRIGYATSPDGITWKKKPSTPAVDTGGAGSWEEWYVNGPSVIFNGTAYQLWYTGSNGVNAKVGYATSADGLSWSKNPANPVMNNGPGPWDSVHAAAPSVVYDGISYHMWYCGFDGTNWRIGYATSPDGIAWTKSGSNPVLDLGSPGDWDGVWVHDPTVIFDGVTYHMWFGGYDGVKARIGYATSPDGINWSPYAGNLCSGTSGDGCVFDIGPVGAWDYNGIEDSMVVLDGNTYMMWYSGYDGLNPRIGFATSMDGINWTRHSGNPVLDLGPSGYWDDSFIYEPTVVVEGSNVKMWFGAHDGAKTRIGYAVKHYWRTGNFSSSVFDSGADGTIWNSINWTESLPSGTNITIATRSGDTPTPDTSWSLWGSEIWAETGSIIASPASRYIQYRATLVTADRDATPILSHVNINYTLADTNMPTISDLTEDPDPQYEGGTVGITARVTDDFGVDLVRINIEGVGNYTMNYDPLSDLYHYNASYSAIGTYNYTIWAKDTSENWNSASSSFAIIELPDDEEPPDDWWWILLVIIIIILIIIILFLLMRKRKKEEEEEPAPPQAVPPPSPDESSATQNPPPPPPQQLLPFRNPIITQFSRLVMPSRRIAKSK
jgi:predicted GH43/DUF377 family glycosyl hydrolase